MARCIGCTLVHFKACVSTLYRKWSWCPCHQVIDSAGRTTCELFPCSKDPWFLLNPDALKQTDTLLIATAASVLPHLLKHLNIGTFLLYSWSFSRLWNFFWLGCCCCVTLLLTTCENEKQCNLPMYCHDAALIIQALNVFMSKLRKCAATDLVVLTVLLMWFVCVCVCASTGLCSGPGAHWGWSRHQGNAEAAGEYLLRVVFVFLFVMVHHPIYKPTECGQEYTRLVREEHPL